ncbi:MAG: hypothetical protein J6P81_03785 [Spirochaetales bacterium]|nr:hypothetical protein [Spirochaetales bacterium]MBO6048214.1 hypothetical protein [Spirochaetales bacterium]MBO7348829.1 hypothetical protein [Spirochaetales bacterium]
MKRRCSADKKRIALLILITALFCLCACRTTTGTDHDQIVKAAINLADSYTSLSRYEDALSVYDRAIEQADDYRLYYNKAIILSSLGRNLEAARLCSESFERFSDIISFKVAEAKYLRLAGDNSGSYSAYLKELELNPYDRETRIRLIDNLIEDGQNQMAYDQAILMWNQGYRDEKGIEYLYTLQPNNWEVLYFQITGRTKEQ